MKADNTDSKILAVLMEDGRASFREIARRTSLTTPTVSSRVARMIKAGLIQKFVPVFAPDSLQRGVVALVVLKVESDPEGVAERLAALSEVEGVYLTTGENEITVKVAIETVQSLHSFLRENAKQSDGLSLVSSQIVTRVVKDSPASPLPGPLNMDLRCDYCQGEVTSTRPYNLAAGSSRYYFCCKTCRAAYLEKHGARLARIKSTRQG
ncbi:MAG: winged helix-turn-helix transcriptional regulator [Thaumarchaeota archaeon]|nr:winged helix-turn-helix transcriptional regulator [Nitrososphaerota archaeon]